MKLFTIGPVQMHPETLEVRKMAIPYFRTKEFSDFTFEMDRKFKQVIGTAQESQAVYLTASGTAAMEAAVINCFDRTDNVLVIVGGSFGKRFSAICSIHDIPHTDIEVPFGKALTEEDLLPYDGKGYTGLLVNLDESSTGQLYDVHMLHRFCARNGILLVVDAITSFLCDPYRMDEFGVDVTIASSQKGLALSPGLAIITLNERAVRRTMEKDPKCMYFDFKDYYKNMERGQMPFTPAIGIFMELDDMLSHILSIGLDRHLAHIADNATYFRTRIGEFEGYLPGYPLSNAITPVMFHDPICTELFHALRKRGLVVNPTGGERANTMIRVAHVGDLEREDYDELIKAICEERASLLNNGFRKEKE